MLDPVKFARLDSQYRVVMTEAERQRRNVLMARVIAIAMAVLGAGMLTCLLAIAGVI